MFSCSLWLKTPRLSPKETREHGRISFGGYLYVSARSEGKEAW